MTPTAPTPEQIAAIRQKFNEASVRSYPSVFSQIDPAKNPQSIFELESQEGVLNLVNNLSETDRGTRADKLIAARLSVAHALRALLEGLGSFRSVQPVVVGWHHLVSAALHPRQASAESRRARAVRAPRRLRGRAAEQLARTVSDDSPRGLDQNSSNGRTACFRCRRGCDSESVVLSHGHTT